jgi:hypothetical protein
MCSLAVFAMRPMKCPFHKKTYIQPENQFAVSHYDLRVHQSGGRLQVCGALPEDFRDRLLCAIRDSLLLDRKGKHWLAEALGIRRPSGGRE